MPKAGVVLGTREVSISNSVYKPTKESKKEHSPKVYSKPPLS